MGLIIVHNRLAEKTKNVSITIKEPQRIWDQTDVQIIFSRAYASVTIFWFWHRFPNSNKNTKSGHLTTDSWIANKCH